MSTKEHWEEAYAARPVDRVSWYQERPGLSLEIIASAVDTDAAVIDVGAGASTLVDNLLGVGFKRVGVLDLSGAALAVVRDRLGDRADAVDWYEMDVSEFEGRGEWDLWHDRAVFHFLVDPADRVAYRKALDSALRPGGQVVIATFALDGPEKCSGLNVERYDPVKLAAELGPAYTLIESEKERHVKPDGGEQSFQFCRFRKEA